ncbi:MAG TPA: hypothetical protein VI299_14060 [Polyangiales bacterium]
MSRALSVLLLLGLVACTHTTIPNTDVEDTPDSREVVSFVETYRQAVVSRDISRLLGLVAENYYDDMGTPQGDDDVDREVLKERLEKTFGPELLAVHYDIRYRDVVFLPTKVLVDYTYIGRFRVSTPDGTRWERRLADNRMVLARKKDGTYSIMSGM